MKELNAQKRKDEQLSEIVSKACKEDQLLSAKERREEYLALRAATLDEMKAKANEALKRQNAILEEKQTKASFQSRRERAALKRRLMHYEKRAALLQTLEMHDEAMKRSRHNKHLIALAAREEIERSRDIGRRVRSARLIQRWIRRRCGWVRNVVEVELTQNEAVERLQGWIWWRGRVCLSRFKMNGGAADGHCNEEALHRLVQMFPLSAQNDTSDSSSSFDHLCQRMMHPETMQLVNTVLECLRPITKTSGDGRIVLSLLLIAICPRDVLGDDYDNMEEDGENARSNNSKCARLLAKWCRRLLECFNVFCSLLNSSEFESFSFPALRSNFIASSSLFDIWKNMDLETLLEGMRIQLQQSWAIYLTSSKALAYLAEVTGVDIESQPSPRKDDPLISLRLRHEASRAGSKSHIKRIRLSLNKLVGDDEAKDIIKAARNAASAEIAESNVIAGAKDEIDAMLSSGNTVRGSDVPDATPREPELALSDAPSGIAEEPESMGMTGMLPPEIIANGRLVHRILLTDSADFDKLSWDGTNAQAPNITAQEFMEMFLPQSDDDAAVDVSARIIESMKVAFFRQIAMDVDQSSFESIRSLLSELHDKMRSLLPNRKDLHSHLDDEHIVKASSLTDVTRILIRSGYLLCHYLESPARAQSTQEILQSLEEFNNRDDESGGAVPYGIESANLFVVASAGFLLQKAELCQMDISNYKIASAAPLIHHVGENYERMQFQKTFGDFERASIDSLKSMLPSTWGWLKGARVLFESEGVTAQSSFEQKMDFVKCRGFVDGVLFTRSQLSLPELFTMDAENIGYIRDEARCSVISSALVLHSCKISNIPTSILSSEFIPEEVPLAMTALNLVLRRRHGQQESLETSVTHATEDLANSLANRTLTATELDSLKNHVVAVLRGNDPVLKLLDNRVQAFFRFACKWKPNSNGPLVTPQPIEMKTGRSMLKGEETGVRNNGLSSTKKDFRRDATKEASRLGFYFSSELVDVGDTSRRVVSLACDIYGRGVLDRLLSVEVD